MLHNTNTEMTETTARHTRWPNRTLPLKWFDLIVAFNVDIFISDPLHYGLSELRSLVTSFAAIVWAQAD